jgi:hypothetical protein
MKYYETHFEEYIHSLDQLNLHPELENYRNTFPANVSQFGNLIVYGASGIGKYSQVLKCIQKYSPSGLKYDKHMIIQTEKQTYMYRISDIHYEIDMALLGCNSKMVWHEIFSQIVDIVSMKSDKNGIIVCKHFHSIHTELLDIFYSYMQQYNHPQLNIHIKFILITEHVSFLSSRILDNCRILQIKRPSKELYQNYLQLLEHEDPIVSKEKIEAKPTNYRSPPPPLPPPAPRQHPLGQKSGNKRALPPLENQVLSVSSPHLCDIFTKQISKTAYSTLTSYQKSTILDNVNRNDILNLKELRSLSISIQSTNVPKEIFNNVCDDIIRDLMNPNKLIITAFRDTLYDILIYNLDAVECFWHIFTHFILLRKIGASDISCILDKTYTFLKYYNNNYRPIYHLENIFLLLLTKIQ